MPDTDTRPVALITGTSTGIGRATVDRFARGGWRVAATMRNPAASDLVGSPDLQLIALDVNDEASIAAGVAATVAAFGRIDALVNNAGYAQQGAVEALPMSALRRQFETNVFGLMSMTQHCLPHLRATRGSVINIASIGGRMAFPFGAAYHGTKWAVEGMSEAMRFELRRHGVRVRIIEPGGIKTDFGSRSISWAEHPEYEPEMSGFRDLFARFEGRLPGPEPVADAIFEAATSQGGRLRWTVKPGLFFRLHQILPDPVWRRLVHAILARAAASRPRASAAA